MILVIRIAGQVELSHAPKETLHRLRLRRKYSAVLLQPTPENLKLLKKIRNQISYGPITKETILELIKKRAQPIKKETKIDAEEIVSQLDKKSLKDLGLKPFFRLHPPRGGIDAKKHCGTTKKAVLGENKKIDDLVRRML